MMEWRYTLQADETAKILPSGEFVVCHPRRQTVLIKRDGTRVVMSGPDTQGPPASASPAEHGG